MHHRRFRVALSKPLSWMLAPERCGDAGKNRTRETGPELKSQNIDNGLLHAVWRAKTSAPIVKSSIVPKKDGGNSGCSHTLSTTGSTNGAAVGTSASRRFCLTPLCMTSTVGTLEFSRNSLQLAAMHEGVLRWCLVCSGANKTSHAAVEQYHGANSGQGAALICGRRGRTGASAKRGQWAQLRYEARLFLRVRIAFSSRAEAWLPPKLTLFSSSQF